MLKDIDFTEQKRVIPFTTRKLLVRTDTSDYEEYDEYEEYNLYFDEFEAFLEAERDFKHTPSLELNMTSDGVRIGLAHDYEMMLSQEDWITYASWKALGVKNDI